MTSNDNLHEILSNAAKKRAEKLGRENYVRMGKLSVEKRLRNLTPEQRSEYFSKVSKGEKIGIV